MEEVEIGTEVSNGIYFTNSIVSRLFATIPQEVSLFWKPVLQCIKKPTGFGRWDNGVLVAIYLNVNTPQIRNCTLKFSYLDKLFTFDSIYTSYDTSNQVSIFPYENRYNSMFDLIAVYKLEIIEVEGKKYKLNFQYKNNKKIKEYYITREHATITTLQDLIDIDAIEYDKLKQTINLHQFRVREVPNISYYFIN